MLSEKQIIDAGGNFWEKGNLKRIYFDNDLISKVFNLKLSETAKYAGQFKSIKKAKVWFDCNSQSFHADKGMVRVMFSQNQIACSK